MYFFNPIYPIFKASDKLCCGIPNSNNYVEFEYLRKTEQLLENIILNGITENDIRNSKIYKKISKNRLLVNGEKLNMSRKNAYFDYLGVNKFSTLDLNSSIIIFGAGAGGSTLCYLLAQFGLKNITIIDDDIVEKAEIEKTMVFRKEHIGSKKVSALKSIILSNFDVSINIIEQKIHTKDQTESIIKERGVSSIIVKACDPDLEFRVNLNAICFKTQTPFIHMAYSYEKLIIGPMFVPGKTKSDLTLNEYQKKFYGKHFDFSLVTKLFTTYTKHPSISFNINILASIILKEILFFIKQKHDCVNCLGKQLIFNPIKMQGYAIDLNKI